MLFDASLFQADIALMEVLTILGFASSCQSIAISRYSWTLSCAFMSDAEGPILVGWVLPLLPTES